MLFVDSTSIIVASLVFLTKLVKLREEGITNNLFDNRRTVHCLLHPLAWSRLRPDAIKRVLRPAICSVIVLRCKMSKRAGPIMEAMLQLTSGTIT
jgi:hypothetical protein